MRRISVGTSYLQELTPIEMMGNLKFAISNIMLFFLQGCFASLPLEKCSCYAPTYTKEKLFEVKKGMDTSAVIKILGKPLSIYTCSPCTREHRTEYIFQYVKFCKPKEGFCENYVTGYVSFDSSYHVINFGEGILET